METVDFVSKLEVPRASLSLQRVTQRLPIGQMVETAIQTIMRLIIEGHSIVMTLSSGKDSTTTTLLCLEAIRRVALQGKRQPPLWAAGLKRQEMRDRYAKGEITYQNLVGGQAKSVKSDARGEVAA